MPDRATLEALRSALLKAAAAAYEDARICGLCGDGAWEIALGVIRDFDLTAFAETTDPGADA